MDHLGFTLEFIKHNRLRAILLAPRLKRPPKGQFPITTDVSEILEHLDGGGNVGILGGSIAIFDFDDMSLATDMFMAMGPLDPHVRTGTGKRHCYVQMFEECPARIRHDGQLVGEIQRGAKQYVVAPPSIHPNGQPYEWLTEDLTIPELPTRWKEYLVGRTGDTVEIPDWLKDYAPLPEHVKDGGWSGPTPAEIINIALTRPGAVRRSMGVKFQCAGCRAEGHDKHQDNALVLESGFWGCAWAKDGPEEKKHRQAIGVDLGIFADLASIPVPGITEEVVVKDPEFDISSIEEPTFE